MAKTYEPIATYTVSGSPLASYTFTSIPQTYTDLIIACKDMATTSIQGISVQVGNGSIDTGSNYSRTVLDGYNSVLSDTANNVSYLDIGVGSPSSPGTSLYHFMNYSNTTTNKAIISRSGTPEYLRLGVGTWRSTSAINQIKIYPGYSWAVGTMLTLFGIKAA
jgi:hypothetical protein